MVTVGTVVEMRNATMDGADLRPACPIVLGLSVGGTLFVRSNTVGTARRGGIVAWANVSTTAAQSLMIASVNPIASTVS